MTRLRPARHLAAPLLLTAALLTLTECHARPQPFAAPVPPVLYAAQAQGSALIVEYPRIQSFRGDFKYSAYGDRVLLRDNSSGATATVTARAVGFAPAPVFKPTLDQNGEVRERLGPALTEETALFEGRLSVQLFQGGAMLFEPASRTIWWGWHGKRSVGSLPPAPVEGKPAPPVAPGAVEGAVLDPGGALTAEYGLQLRAALRDLRQTRGFALGVAFISPMPGVDGKQQADETRKQMIAAGVLPEESALLTLIGAESYVWHRSRTLDARITWEKVQEVWKAAAAGVPDPAVRALRFVAGLGTTLAAGSNMPPTPAAPAELPRPGAVLGEGRVSPSGGRVEAAGVTLEFPAGSLPREERVILHASATSPGASGFYFVEREGRGLFPKPVQARLPVPQGTDGSRLVMVQQVDGSVWQVLPSRFDPASRTISAGVSHFSGLGWLDPTERKHWIFTGGTAGFLGTSAGVGTYVILTGGSILSAPITVTAAAVVVVGTLAGAFGGDVAYNAYRQAGMVGPFPVEGFDILWDPSAASGPHLVAMVHSRTGELLGLFKPEDVSPPTALPQGTTIELPGGKLVQLSDLAQHKLPLSVLDLSSRLQHARKWYRAGGFKVPDRTTVLVHSKLGTGHAGEWDGKVLSVRAGLLSAVSAPPVGDAGALMAHRDFLATLAHEYWHAVSSHNGYRESFPGADDCWATTFETAVFMPSSNEFVKGYPWKDNAGVLANGLLMPGSGEGVDETPKRGYRLWSWGKFLLHEHGVAVVRQHAAGELEGALLSNLWIQFTRSLLTAEGALPDPDDFAGPDGFTGPAITGWKDLKLEDLAVGQQVLAPGRADVPRSRPLSFRLATVNLTARSASEPAFKLVVRRQEPDPTEQIVLLRPTAAGELRPAANRDELEFGDRGAAADSKWVEGGGRMPVALVGRAVSPLPGRINPLLVYRLVPPADLKVTAVPAPPGKPAEAKTKLEFPLPQPAPGLPVQATYAGYRLYGRDRDGTETLIAELLFPAAAAPPGAAGWYRGSAPFRVDVTPEQKVVEVPAEKTARFTALGIAAIDGLLVEGGQPVTSPVFWKTLVAEEASLHIVVKEPKPDKLPNNPFEVLDGIPIPGAKVTVAWTHQGVPVRREVTADKNGVARLLVPMDVEISVTFGKETKKVRCAPANPRGLVTFGWQGHEVKIDKTVPTPPGDLPPPPIPKR